MAEERPVKRDAEDAAALVQDLRRRIDELDELLVRTLSARAACALEVGRQKKRLGLEIYQPSREADVQEVDVDKLKEMVHVKDEDLAKLDEFVVKQGHVK